MWTNTVYHGKILFFKGTMSRNFSFGFFSWIIIPPAPDFPISEVFEFVRKLAKIFTNQGAPPVAGKFFLKRMFFLILRNIITILPISGDFLSAYFNLNSSGFTFACPFQATLFK
jgi:hypothetical protein